MDTSILLARVLGISLIVLYLGTLINMHLYRGFIKSITDHPIFIVISGFVGLVLGLLMIQFHNIWIMDWRVIVTIFGWILFISGSFRLLFTDMAIKLSQKALAIPQMALTSLCIFLILIGLFLTYKGFA